MVHGTWCMAQYRVSDMVHGTWYRPVSDLVQGTWSRVSDMVRDIHARHVVPDMRAKGEGSSMLGTRKGKERYGLGRWGKRQAWED